MDNYFTLCIFSPSGGGKHDVYNYFWKVYSGKNIDLSLICRYQCQFIILSIDWWVYHRTRYPLTNSSFSVLFYKLFQLSKFYVYISYCVLKQFFSKKEQMNVCFMMAFQQNNWDYESLKILPHIFIFNFWHKFFWQNFKLHTFIQYVPGSSKIMQNEVYKWTHDGRVH